MANTYTTNYSWIMPEVGLDTDAWGGHLNYNFGDPDNGLDKIVKGISDVANAALPKAGGTVTGAVTFSGSSTTLTMGAPIVLTVDPTSVTHATHKKYVDDADATLSARITTSQNTADAALARSGGTMTGFITLHANPTASFHAATKAYADTKLALNGGTMSGDLVFASNQTTATTSAPNIVQLTDSISSTSVTTAATPNSVRTSYNLANAALARSGGTMTGNLVFAAGQTTATTSAPNIVQLTDSVGSTSTTTAATPNSVKVSYDLANSALQRSGGTMTGYLTLAADPATGLHAATAQYVYNNFQPLDGDLTAIAGQTGTGFLKRAGTNSWTLDTNTYLTGNQSISISGDATGNGATSISLTLSNSGVSAGTYNDSATSVRPFTVDSKGRVTSIGSAVTITPAWGNVTGKPSTVDGYGITDAVKTSGSSMSGYLTLAADPVNALHAATKQYVDTYYMPKTGGTFSGNITISNTANYITLQDTDNSTFYIHNNSGVAGILKPDAAWAFYTDTSGNFTAAQNITAYSDERLKENIQTIEYALDRVRQMRGVYYTRKENGSAGLGVIAQEVQRVFPEVVQENNDGILSVAYGNLVGVLIEAVKELADRVEELEYQK